MLYSFCITSSTPTIRKKTGEKKLKKRDKSKEKRRENRERRDGIEKTPEESNDSSGVWNVK